jgi:hypothetical protein
VLNISQWALRLGIDKAVLSNKLREYNLKPKSIEENNAKLYSGEQIIEFCETEKTEKAKTFIESNTKEQVGAVIQKSIEGMDPIDAASTMMLAWQRLVNETVNKSVEKDKKIETLLLENEKYKVALDLSDEYLTVHKYNELFNMNWTTKDSTRIGGEMTRKSFAMGIEKRHLSFITAKRCLEVGSYHIDVWKAVYPNNNYGV